MDNIDKLLYFSGVAAEYLDYSGQLRELPRAVRVRALEACGIDWRDDSAVGRAIFELDAQPWQSWLRRQYVVNEDYAALDDERGVYMHCAPEWLEGSFQWSVRSESGEEIRGEVVPAHCIETGDYRIDGIRYSRRKLPLPTLPLGYHRLSLRGGNRREDAELVVCPLKSFAGTLCAEKSWGISCQLYTLRSERNWGVGDFEDLRELVRLAAAAGADYIGLNPLHAPCADDPDSVSPYSPSDRRFVNPIYIHIEAVDEFRDAIVQRWFGDEIRQKLQSLKQGEYVDYDSINRLKYECLTLMYTRFRDRDEAASSSRARDFQRFIDEQGAELQAFAAFERQHNIYATGDDCDTRFFCFLQWLAHSQLEGCQQLAQARKMRVGLLGDLAVGSVGQGCEASSNPHLYASGATIGAPPDPLGPLGQDWGLPVINPVAMRNSGFRQYIALLRANMRSYGALRIDHAMALLRLWWCFPATDDSPQSGVYVYYPFAELLSLLRLESVRNQCLVICEDLGVVPAEFRQAMADSGLYSNNLLYFDQYNDQYFTPLDYQQEDALLMVTNHDVPTLFDWWNGSDLQRRFDLGLIQQKDDLLNQIDHRNREKQKLLNWLAEANLLPSNRSQYDLVEIDLSLCAAIHRACARGASRLLLLQLEDLQLMAEPVNIPGTHLEYPNWRRKQQSATSDIFASQEVGTILHSVNEERRHEIR